MKHWRAIVAVATLLSFAAFTLIQQRRHAAEVRTLQNQLAELGKTVVVAPGVATKPAISAPIPDAPKKVKGTVVTRAKAIVTPPDCKPVEVTVDVVQTKEGAKAVVTTAPDGYVDIPFAAIDAEALKPRWYERVSVTGIVVGVGDKPVVGVGIGYDVGSLTVSAAVFSNRSVGVITTWRPFRRF